MPSRSHGPFVGDLIEDIETAKQLIAKYPDVDLEMLAAVASDRTQPVSARVAAIYTLGFTDDHHTTYSALAQIARDPDESETVRDHAAEAVGYMDGSAFSDPTP